MAELIGGFATLIWATCHCATKWSGSFKKPHIVDTESSWVIHQERELGAAGGWGKLLEVKAETERE